MMTMATPRDALLPRPPGGLRRGLLLALVAHGLLVAGLSFSVRWHTQAPDAAEAELWASVPRAAAPRAAEPPPPPQPVAPPTSMRITPPRAAEPEDTRTAADAQIAVEREQQRKNARQRAAEQAEAKRREAQQAAQDAAAAEKRKQQERQQQQDQQQQQRQEKQKQQAAKALEAQAEQLQAQREANLKRIIGEAGGSATAGTAGVAAQSAAPSADYIGRIKGRIRPNVSFPNTLEGNPSVEVEVRMAPDGRILSTRLLKASGAPEWDAAVLRAIDKTEALPRDENGRVPPALTIVYRPRDF